ncbi:MAG: hypothetical protein AB1646_12985 [Thermodesulfobacteriota bacterium]
MNNLVQFVGACETGTDRATFYNSATQQTQSLEELHKGVLDFDRELYSLALAFGGFNDYNKLLITRNLLFQTGYVIGRDGKRHHVRAGKSADFAVQYGFAGIEKHWRELEDRIIVQIVWDRVPIPRLLREFASWRKLRLNNARSKRLVLRFILGNQRLAGWAMRYRPGLKRALSHAWGDARARRLKKLAGEFLRDGGSAVDSDLDRWVFRFIGQSTRSAVCEAICFIFGELAVPFATPLFAQYVEALSNPEKLLGLPYDIAIGLRNRLHKDVPKSTLIGSRATQEQMSKKQRVKLQRSAAREGVRVAMDLGSQGLVEIIKYGYEMGFSGEVRDAVAARVKSDAARCPLRPRHVAVVIDTSRSMYGKDDRKLHPISVALSIGLLMKETAERCDLFYTGDVLDEFPIPTGDTDLAWAVLRAYKSEPELVLLITDGYENVTAGTLDHVVRALRKIGCQAPLVQFSPVLASEVGGDIRKVADSTYALAVGGPESIASMYAKFLLVGANDPEKLLALKKYLLGKLGGIEIPGKIQEALDRAEDLRLSSGGPFTISED